MAGEARSAAAKATVAAAPEVPPSRRPGVEVALAMVPYYLERTCQAPCSVNDLELLEWGLRQVGGWVSAFQGCGTATWEHMELTILQPAACQPWCG